MHPFIINAVTLTDSVNCLQLLHYMVIIISYNILLKIELSSQNMNIRKKSWVIAEIFFSEVYIFPILPI